ncbi:MAG: SUMF1/EgtB/PvdO family nonheme iron enzyme [Acidobacteriaceae bacterium]|nr:SUMF1/EgtB/PvdO family nonheme iron enzyme [Acidobacteriaceae bacterium]
MCANNTTPEWSRPTSSGRSSRVGWGTPRQGTPGSSANSSSTRVYSQPRSTAAVLRGGSWNNNPANVRVSLRFRNEPANRNNNIGFRCAGYAERHPAGHRRAVSRSRILHGGSGRATSVSGP